MSDQIGAASIRLGVDSSGVDAGLNHMEASVTQAGRSLSSLGRTGAAAVDQIGAGAAAASTRVDASTRSIQSSIQRVTAATEAGAVGTRAYFEALANQRGANLDTLRPFLDQLDQVRTRQQEAAAAAARSGSAFQSQGQSAAALAASLRQVPAQLTDIVTSIQGGQAPLTVFLQQGGQLRDMFGSAGGAARALGGYLLSLVSPLTVTAAAVAVLAVAYSQGSKEADAFRKSIILTGNAAGVTTSQLAGMAKEASNVAGTQGANAEALAALVGTGKVAADQLVRASVTAVQSQKLLGIAVEDTVKAFADLGKDPLQATLKLNDQYNYLTLATYKQIKALTDQKSTAEAAKVAQVAYADAMDQKNKQVAASLGTLEKAWDGTKGAAKGAWDAMLNVGREDTIDAQIAAAQAKLEKAKLAFYAYSGGSNADKTADQAEAQRQLDRLQNIKKVGDLTAQYAAEDAKSRDAAIAFDQSGEQYLSRELKLQKDIAAARAQGQAAAQRGEDPAVTEKRIQDRIQAIRSTYADYFNQTIEAQIAAVTRLGAVQEEQAKRALIPIQADNDAGLNKSLDKQFAYIDAIAKADEQALVRQKASLQQRLALTAQETVGIDGQAAHKEKLADLNSQIELKDEQIATRRKQRDAEIFVADKKNSDAITESYKAIFDARQSDLDALDQQLKAQNDQNAAIGLNVKQLGDLNTRLVDEKASRLEVQASIIANTEGREDEAEVLRKTATRMRELNTAQIEGARKAADFDAYNEFWKSIDRSAQDAFTHIGEGGKSMLDRLSDSLKSGLLDLLYQLTVKQFIINVKANVASDGFGAIAGALSGSSGGSSGASLFGTAANLYSVGKSIYNGFATGFSATLGGSVTTLGNLFGSTALSSFGAGMGLTAAQAGEAAAAYTSAAAAATAAGDTAAAAAYTSTASGLSGGAGAAGAVPIIGWIIAGMAAADGFRKQGFDPNNGSTNTNGIISGLPAVASNKLLTSLGVGDALANILSGASINTRLFGRANPVLKDQKLSGTINASGIDATNSATIFEKGGLFRSDKSTPISSPLDATTDEAFDKTIKNMVSSVKGFGKAIGEQTTQIDSYTKAFNLALTGDATKDNALINDLFTGVGNDLATLLVPSIAKLSKEGENAAQTLERVANDYVAIDGALGAIGLDFGKVGTGSLEARESLLSLSGGLDNFVSKAEFFSQNYLSESERVAAVTKQLDGAFTDLGVTVIPKTRDQFAELVKGLDLSTDAGQKMFVGLMNLEEVFAQVTPQIDKAAVLQQQRQLDIQLMEALGNAEGALAATRADALDALLSDQAKITQAQINAAQDAKKVYDDLVKVGDDALSGLSKSINAEKARINDAYNTQATAIRDATQASVESAQKSLQAAQTQVAALQTVFGALDSALGSSKIESDAATLARRQAAQAVLSSAAANPKDLGNNKDLANAISTISGQSNTRLFGTFEDYARDQARTNNTLAALHDAAGTQVDAAQQTVDKLTEQIDIIQKNGDELLDQLKNDNQSQLDALDAQLLADTQQLDALKGINSSVLSLKDAMAEFAAAIAGLKQNPTATQNNVDVVNDQNGTTATGVEGLYQSVLGRHSDEGGLKFWTDALNNGETLTEIKQEFLNSDEYKKLRGFAVGTNRVPFNMTANIHEDERIIPAADNRQLMALMARATDPQQNAVVLADQLKRNSIAMEQQQTVLDRIAKNTGTAADVLDGASKGGRPIGITEAG